MAIILSPIVPCTRKTIQIDENTCGVNLQDFISERATATFKKQIRWYVFLLSPPEGATTNQIYGSLWNLLGGDSRYLSVATRDGSMWALIYKGDQKVPQVPDIVESAYEIDKPDGGQATRNAILAFANAWFVAQEATFNFALEQDDEPRALVENAR